MPGPKTRSVARGEVSPHVYLLVATALMPQNDAAVAANQWAERRLCVGRADPPAKGGADSLERGILERLPNSIGCDDLRPRIDSAALHGGRGRADRSGAVRPPRHRVGARQRARPGVPARGRRRRRRAQDLEPQRGRVGARSRGGRDRARRRQSTRTCPSRGRSRRERRSTATRCGCSSGGTATRPGRSSTTPRCARSRRRTPGSASRSGRSSTLPRAGSCSGICAPRPLLRPLLDEIAEPERQALAARALDGYDERVLPRWERLRAQVVHGDFNLDNLLLDDDGAVAGILDFGDCCHTALAADVAVALASFLRGRPPEDAFRVARIALDGFSSRLPLEPLELELLGDLVSARLVAIVAISAWRSRRFPENAEYIEAWDDDSWQLLELLDDLGPERGRARARRTSPCGVDPGARRRRNEALGALLTPLTYARPVHAVRAEGVWIHEADGSRLLDAYNNVPVVGHCHPRVTEAIVRQTRLSAVNARYLARAAGRPRRAAARDVPAGGRPRHGAARQLRQRGERRRLAARGRDATGNAGALVTEHAYHGVTTATTALSPEEWPRPSRPSARRAHPTAGKRGRPRPRARRDST